MQKYVVDVGGVRMGLPDFSGLVGLSYYTVLYRAQKGKKLVLPQEVLARSLCLDRVESVTDEKSGKVGSFSDGYTFDELAELYKNFAGQEDEVRMVMDFTGVPKRAAENLIIKLRENAESNRRAIA